MPWETRGGRGRYYTRTRKIGGHRRREYVGCGPQAHAAAQADALQRAEREAQAAALREERARLREADAAVLQLFQLAGLVATAALVAGGFHRHGGEWRICHGERKGREEG
jgi:hypothetical protein